VTDVNPQLIGDLARLASRYGPDEWERLLHALEDDGQRGQVTMLLRELASTSRSRQRRQVRGSHSSARVHRVREALTTIRGADPARAAALEEVWQKLRERELLPTMPLVRSFAQATGLKGLQSSKREQAVTELMEYIVAMPPDELQRIMRETVVQDEGGLTAEYERWVSLILGQPSEAPIPADLPRPDSESVDS